MNVDFFTGDEEPFAYIVMPKYGQNLESLLLSNNFDVSENSVISIGLKLMDILEVIHKSGLVYNDLKLDNILIGDSNDNL